MIRPLRSSNSSSARQTNRRGAAVVEMAVILPVFMMVLLGIVEFGRAMMVTQIVSNAAREGARRAILNGSTNATVSADIAEFVSSTCRVDTTSISVEITIQAGPDNPNPLDQLANANEGDLVTVRVRVPFQEVSYIRGNYLNGMEINGQATMRHE